MSESADAHIDIDLVVKELDRRDKGFIDLLVFDPLYQGLPLGVDENSNLEMASHVRKLVQLAKRKDFALLLLHHMAKGNSAQKRVSDCAAGAGSLSRMAHSFVALREHEKENHYVVDTLMRRASRFLRPAAAVSSVDCH